MTPIALQTPRHACHACGGCCHGAVVRLTSPEEASRIRSLADTLGIPDPIVDGALRRVDGACVFLQTDARCGIHAHAGLDAKPAVCRQYPLLYVDDGVQVRVGVDPGCYTALSTSLDGPALPVDHPEAITPVRAPPETSALEGALLTRAVRADDSLADALLAVLPPDADLGAVLARWSARLRSAPLAPRIAQTDAGRPLREALAPVLAAPGPTVLPTLPPELERAVVGAARTFVFLRVSRALPPHVALLVVLLGAVSCANAARDDRAAFARAFAAWTRALRAPTFLRALFPDEAAVRHLVTGNT